MTTVARSFRSIREWDGSKHRAFEELCYQLRDPVPNGSTVVKTGDPDGGYEWYMTSSDGTEWGWQAKYVFDIDNLLRLMARTLRTVADKRPKCRRLTFCIPFDLSDSPGSGSRKSARRKFDDRKLAWSQSIAGADQIEIRLWSAGDLLERLSGHPNHRGIEWFFWNKEVLSLDWLHKRHGVTLDAVGHHRYSRQLHVELPVSFALDGLGRSPGYWQRFRRLHQAVLTAARPLALIDSSEPATSSALQVLREHLAGWSGGTPEGSGPTGRLDRDRLTCLTRRCSEAASAAYPRIPLLRDGDRAMSPNSAEAGERDSLRFQLSRLLGALEDVGRFLAEPASEAAAKGALVVFGEAGQGKTHLFCDVVRKAIESSRPAILVLGGRLLGRNPWQGIADSLGLPPLGSETLIGAMHAAAEAAGYPFLLLIDALNESDDARAWREELPSLVAEVSGNPWISIGVSVRSTYQSVVLPSGGLDHVAVLHHTGFADRVSEATERFFDAHGLQQPRVPLLTPEFANPLFLKLYCESLRDMGKHAPEAGEAHVTEVFGWYLRQKANRIALELSLDPANNNVHTAVQRFCQALAAANSDSLVYSVGSSLLDGAVPWRKEWPNTLTGQLLSEGVLTKDMAWLQDEYQEVLRFTYQRLADYAVARVVLDSVGSDLDCLRAALGSGEPLNDRLADAPAGWIEALAVIIPERFGVEALDAIPDDSPAAGSKLWEDAFVQSLVARRPRAVTARTIEQLNRIHRESPRLRAKILDAVLSVAAVPDHPLNARALHRLLTRLPLPDRDRSWSQHTYHALHDGSPLGRLLRWAARKRHGDDDVPDDVVELAAVTLIWTFTSPNRYLRDYATKAVVQLLARNLEVLASVISRFRGVDDPYVIERLSVVAHGAVICGREDNLDTVLRIATAIKNIALDPEQNPNLLTRDAVRGVYERCLRLGAIDRPKCEGVLPPYGSSPPDAPRRASELRQLYDRRTGGAGIGDYHALFGSLFSLGDFGNYIVARKLGYFDGPMFDIPSEPQAESNRMRDELARCWIFERVLSLGWTPERFGDFDRATEVPPYTRSSHKAERFGKKYQWIAVRELMARLTDNLIFVGWRGEAVPYVGPWQVLGRDIDPTLPPPPWVRQDDGDVQVGSTFADDSEVWWVPILGAGSASLPLDAKWASRQSDLPWMAELVRRTDNRGDSWVALRAFHPWYYDLGASERDPDEPIRDLRVALYSWLVTPEDQVALATHVSQQTDGLQRMPKGDQNVNDPYLGELPWADSIDDEVAPQCITTDEGPAERIEAYPSWARYRWEGSAQDCSLRHGVAVWSPARELFEGGGLEWIPGTRTWQSRDGSVVARHGTHGGHCSLLVRESWLQRTLSRTGYSLVFGLAGDRRLLKGTVHMGFDEIGVSRYLSGVASLHGKRWMIDDMTAKPR